MTKWRCTICGWIYDPEVGDPKSEVKAGMDFETLAEDYRCPKCGAMKKYFNQLV